MSSKRARLNATVNPYLDLEAREESGGDSSSEGDQNLDDFIVDDADTIVEEDLYPSRIPMAPPHDEEAERQDIAARVSRANRLAACSIEPQTLEDSGSLSQVWELPVPSGFERTVANILSSIRDRLNWPSSRFTVHLVESLPRRLFLEVQSHHEIQEVFKNPDMSSFKYLLSRAVRIQIQTTLDIQHTRYTSDNLEWFRTRLTSAVKTYQWVRFRIGRRKQEVAMVVSPACGRRGFPLLVMLPRFNEKRYLAKKTGKKAVEVEIREYSRTDMSGSSRDAAPQGVKRKKQNRLPLKLLEAATYVSMEQKGLFRSHGKQLFLECLEVVNCPDPSLLDLAFEPRPEDVQPFENLKVTHRGVFSVYRETVLKTYAPGDAVSITAGDLSGSCGTLISIDPAKSSAVVHISSVDREAEVHWLDLRRKLSLGQFVRVVVGSKRGKEGFLVAITQEGCDVMRETATITSKKDGNSHVDEEDFFYALVDYLQPATPDVSYQNISHPYAAGVLSPDFTHREDVGYPTAPVPDGMPSQEGTPLAIPMRTTFHPARGMKKEHSISRTEMLSLTGQRDPRIGQLAIVIGLERKGYIGWISDVTRNEVKIECVGGETSFFMIAKQHVVCLSENDRTMAGTRLAAPLLLQKRDSSSSEQRRSPTPPGHPGPSMPQPNTAPEEPQSLECECSFLADPRVPDGKFHVHVGFTSAYERGTWCNRNGRTSKLRWYNVFDPAQEGLKHKVHVEWKGNHGEDKSDSIDVRMLRRIAPSGKNQHVLILAEDGPLYATGTVRKFMKNPARADVQMESGTVATYPAGGLVKISY